MNHSMSFVWMISGLTGLCAAIGLAESIKVDAKVQENLLSAYLHAATTDGLTGVANRQALDNMLATLLNSPKSKKRQHCMVMMDIDHFKVFNDQWGHQAGDSVLHCVARKLSELFKGDAFVARYGGEEFAIVLSNCSLKNAQEQAEACRKSIRENVCHFRDRTFRVTVSCGVTEAFPSDSPDSLTQRADFALYTAKRLGRDMVWVDGMDLREAGQVPAEFPLNSSHPGGMASATSVAQLNRTIMETVVEIPA